MKRIALIAFCILHSAIRIAPAAPTNSPSASVFVIQVDANYIIVNPTNALTIFQANSNAIYAVITNGWPNLDIDSTDDFDGAYSSLSGHLDGATNDLLTAFPNLDIESTDDAAHIASTANPHSVTLQQSSSSTLAAQDEWLNIGFQNGDFSSGTNHWSSTGTNEWGLSDFSIFGAACLASGSYPDDTSNLVHDAAVETGVYYRVNLTVSGMDTESSFDLYIEIGGGSTYLEGTEDLYVGSISSNGTYSMISYIPAATTGSLYFWGNGTLAVTDDYLLIDNITVEKAVTPLQFSGCGTLRLPGPLTLDQGIVGGGTITNAFVDAAGVTQQLSFVRGTFTGWSTNGVSLLP